jgi:hypothetical protein
MGAHLVDSKTKDKIGITCIDSTCLDGQFVVNDKVINPGFVLALDDIHDLYYHFRVILIRASTSRVPIPQVWHIMNMRKVTKKLNKVFPLMVDIEAKSKTVKMSHKNFLEVIKAIKNY